MSFKQLIGHTLLFGALFLVCLYGASVAIQNFVEAETVLATASSFIMMTVFSVFAYGAFDITQASVKAIAVEVQYGLLQ